MRHRRAASMTVTVCVIGVVTATTAFASPNTPATPDPGAAQTGRAAPAASDVVPGTPGERARATAATALRISSATMRTEPNTADIQFARMMIPHHYQALVMTRLVPERSSDDQVRALAERINVAQGIEIDAMQGWQDRHGLQVTDPQESYQRLLEKPARLEEMGMATPAELEELRAARGNEFDVLFLQLMIPHHEGAITMAEDVVVNGRDVFLRQMAIDMISTQTAQIDTMRQMLERKTS